MNQVWEVSDTEKLVLGLFTTEELAMKAIKFSYNAIKGARFEFNHNANKCHVEVFNGNKYLNTLTITLRPVFDEVVHL